jgi:VanZ family protein
VDKEAKSKFFKFWFPVVFYSGIIFFISSLPAVKGPFEIKHLDKAVHILEYMPFGFLLSRAFFHARWDFSRKNLLGYVILASFLYGLSDEYHQSFVAGRESTVWDALADTIGGMIGAYIYFYGVARKKEEVKSVLY